MLYVVAGTAITPFHGDESTQVYMSRDYAYQFMQRNLELVTFHEPPLSAQEQQLRLLNGTLNKYLIGLAWHSGGFTLSDVNEQWDWGASWEYNFSTNHAPSPALLNAARLPSALLLALGVPAMFALGWLIGGKWTAVAASVLYALHPALLLNGRRAMMEGSLTVFTLLTVLAGAWWIKRRTWGAALALGLAAGLTVASKHTGVFPVAAVFGAAGLVGLFPRLSHTVKTRRTRSGEIEKTSADPSPNAGSGDRSDSPRSFVESQNRVPMGMLVIAGICAAVTFYALNPAWWGDPIRRVSDVLRMRQDLLTGQTNAFGGYADFGAAVAGFWNQAFVTAPQYYEVPSWGGYLAESIAAYQVSGLRGVHVGAPIFAALVFVGVVALLIQVERPLRVLIGAWALGVALSVLLLTPLEWQRYYLPVYPPLLLLAGLGIGAVVRRVTPRLTRAAINVR